jgi:hypothetical protein
MIWLDTAMIFNRSPPGDAPGSPSGIGPEPSGSRPIAVEDIVYQSRSASSRLAGRGYEVLARRR